MIYSVIALAIFVWFCCILCMLMLFKLCNLECYAYRLHQQIEELKSGTMNYKQILNNLISELEKITKNYYDKKLN